MKIRLLIPAVITLALCLGFTACNTAKLAPNGAYTTSTTNAAGAVTVTGDLALYNADLAFQLAYKTMDMIFSVEMNNRQYLWNISPAIKHTIDNVRVSAVQVVADYTAARAAYIANPTPASLSGMQAIVAKIQQLLFAATAAIGTTTNHVPSITVTN